MEVGELIEELQKCNPKAEVVCSLDGEPFMHLIKCVSPLDKKEPVMLCVLQPDYFEGDWNVRTEEPL